MTVLDWVATLACAVLATIIVTTLSAVLTGHGRRRH